MDLTDRFASLVGQWFQRLEATPGSQGIGEFWQAGKRLGAYAALNRLVGVAVPFARRNYFEVQELRRGHVRARIPLKGNRNHIGTLYAGAMFVLAEIPGGVLMLFEMGPGFVPILKELTMSYVKTAKSDVTVEFVMPPEDIERIRHAVEADGKAEFKLEGELRDVEGEIVARSSALYQVRRK